LQFGGKNFFHVQTMRWNFVLALQVLKDLGAVLYLEQTFDVTRQDSSIECLWLATILRRDQLQRVSR
jgi:hypothetical protein